MKSAEPSVPLLVGVQPILEQLRRDPRSIRTLLVARGAGGKAAGIAGQARRAGVSVEPQPVRRLDDLAGGIPHQGLVAELHGYEYADWLDVLGRKPPCLLVADQITDPRNFGALLRSAEATGVGAVVIPKDRSAGVTAVVTKAAAGATVSLPITRVVNLARALEELKREGYWVVGLTGDGPQSIYEFDFPELCALVVGAEGGGLRPLTRKTCDHLVSIPMLGSIESLNVSVAAAVALYERVRQSRARSMSRPVSTD
jgi:23S rRNA (guanosine2251-2'-O)-methyltransferase